MDDFEDDEFEEVLEERPRKKKKKVSDSGKSSKPTKAKRSRPAESSGNGMVWIGAGGLVVLVLLGFALMPVIRKYRLESQRPMASDRLKQIGLAMHNYHDTFYMFPPGVIARTDGTQMLGWEAHLLPYLDQQTLFNRIKFDYPWNSPENQGVFSQRVPQLRSPAFDGSTEPNLSHFAGNSHIFVVNRGLRTANFTDGTSNTIAIGEVSAGFKPWGDPANVRDPALGLGKTPEQFQGPFEGGTHFLIMDGTVRFLKSDIDPKILKVLATPNGGESTDF